MHQSDTQFCFCSFVLFVFEMGDRNIHVFRVASLADEHATEVDLKKEWCIVVYAAALGVKVLLLTRFSTEAWSSIVYQVQMYWKKIG